MKKQILRMLLLFITFFRNKYEPENVKVIEEII